MQQHKCTTIDQIFFRHCVRASSTPERHEALREQFIAQLLPYHEDLICAAHHYILRHTHPHLPSADEFIRFMAPEFSRRMELSLRAQRGNPSFNNPDGSPRRLAPRDDKVSA